MRSGKKREKVLTKMVSIIRRDTGIRPSQLNRLLNLEHSSGLRKILIKRGLVRKERKGAAVHYYLKRRRKV